MKTWISFSKKTISANFAVSLHGICSYCSFGVGKYGIYVKLACREGLRNSCKLLGAKLNSIQTISYTCKADTKHAFGKFATK